MLRQGLPRNQFRVYGLKTKRIDSGNENKQGEIEENENDTER